MIEVSMVPAEYVDTCWNKIEKFVQGAVEETEGRYTVENIYDMAKEGQHHLWVAYEGSDFKGFVTTIVNTYPQRKILLMSFCGGEEFKSWKTPIISLLKRFAKDMGCDSIEAYGRPGWSKILKEEGYKSKFVAFELPI
jgi:hypothetical protein